MYDSLCHQYSLSEDAIRDLQDDAEFEQLVQTLLKVNYGMDWDLFWELVNWNMRNRSPDIPRMCEEEENSIVSRLIDKWFVRLEAQTLHHVVEKVISLRALITRNDK